MQKNSRKGYAVQVTKITKNQAFKIIKASLYIGVSAVLSYLITLTSNSPELFGPFAALINIVLVTLKQLFTPSEA